MTVPPVRLDETNLALIRLLREDGRLTNQDLAEQLGIPASTVRDRVRRLSESQVLRVIALTDYRALGYEFLILLGITVEGRRAREAAADIAASRLVAAVMIMAGKYDVWVMLAVRDKEQLINFVNGELGKVAGLRDIDISLGLEVLKYTTDFSLPRSIQEGLLFESPPGGDPDDLDIRIIKELREDGRTPNRELARRLNVSEGTIRLRIARLEGNGTIKIAGVCNPVYFGMDSFATVGVSADRLHVHPIAREMAAMGPVNFVATALGAYDVVAVVGGTREEVFETIARIGAIEGVRRTETSQMIDAIKFDYTIAILEPDPLAEKAPGRQGHAGR